MKFLLQLLLLLGCAGVFAQSTPFFPEELVVQASALNLRETPDGNGKKIASLPRGTVVRYIDAWNSGQFVQADTTKPDSPYAPWLRVRYQDKTGYVFGAYVSGTLALFYEDNFLNDPTLPALNYYGIYQRDSFADETRKIEVRLEEEENEMYGKVKILKTNQKDKSKFIIGTTGTLPTGYAGPLGIFETTDFFMTNSLSPGASLAIYAGQEPNDTTMKPTYFLTALGCAAFGESFVEVRDYRLYAVDYNYGQVPVKQDMTTWVKTEIPELVPAVSLLWYGDIDHDNKPDAIIQDCPYESGCRSSLFLSSKAPRGEFLHKTCEYFWPGD